MHVSPDRYPHTWGAGDMDWLYTSTLSHRLQDSRPKELFYSMPVIQVKAVTADKADMRDVYQCPVYTTEARFRQEVFTAQLKFKKDHGEIKWILAGVCMFLDVE